MSTGDSRVLGIGGGIASSLHGDASIQVPVGGGGCECSSMMVVGIRQDLESANITQSVKEGKLKQRQKNDLIQQCVKKERSKLWIDVLAGREHREKR